jgi:cytochrome c oxidase cbb3-type subunit III
MSLNRIFNHTLLRLASTVIISLCCFPGTVSAKGGGKAPVPSVMENQVVAILLVIMFILLLAIVLLSHVLRGAADIYRQKMEKEREGKSLPAVSGVITSLLLFLSVSAAAQQTPTTGAPVSSPALPAFTLYVMIGVIILELLLVFVMLQQLKNLLGIRSQMRFSFKAIHFYNPLKNVWAKMNSFKPVEQEADIELGHNYDGISELDNRLPPWWLYGFYATIIFAAVYLWRYHVSETGLSQTQEYEIAMKHAEEQKAAYLKKSANLVDETTVKMLASPADLSTGKGIFEASCSPCHGKSGEGVVGPNLTDDFWLHGGSIKDVFKTIKYGVPEKGMRSWKDDFSPVQLAQLSSYIKSIRGTNPPNGKEKQGQEYKEDQTMTGDSSSAKMNDVVTND